MKYQDIWINGQLIEPGIRECENRYDIVKKFCSENLGNNFSVCDIGANMGYFSIRLIEDFNAKSIAFEFHQFKERELILKKLKTKNLMYVNRKLKLNDILIMKDFAKFDLILALSVLHHVSEPMHEWISALRSISRFTVLEIAMEDSKRTTNKKGYEIHQDYKLLGSGISHLKKDFNRKIIAYKN